MYRCRKISCAAPRSATFQSTGVPSPMAMRNSTAQRTKRRNGETAKQSRDRALLSNLENGMKMDPIPMCNTVLTVLRLSIGDFGGYVAVDVLKTPTKCECDMTFLSLNL